MAAPKSLWAGSPAGPESLFLQLKHCFNNLIIGGEAGAGLPWGLLHLPLGPQALSLDGRGRVEEECLTNSGGGAAGWKYYSSIKEIVMYSSFYFK